MIERMSSDETIIILHKNNDLNQPILAREIEIIVNRMVKAFNDMGANFLFPYFENCVVARNK